MLILGVDESHGPAVIPFSVGIKLIQVAAADIINRLVSIFADMFPFGVKDKLDGAR